MIIRGYITKIVELKPKHISNQIVIAAENLKGMGKGFCISNHYPEIATDKVVSIIFSPNPNDFDFIEKNLGITAVPFAWDIQDLKSSISADSLVKLSILLSKENLIVPTVASLSREALTNILLKSVNPKHCDLSINKTPPPSGSFTDNFTDSNETELSAHTPSGGGAWTLALDGANGGKIYNNGLAIDSIGGGAGDTYYTCTDQGSANHYTQLKANYLLAEGLLFFAVRLVDNDNFIGFKQHGTGAAGWRLIKYVAGSLTDSIVTYQGVAGEVVKVVAGDGAQNNIDIYQDGVQQGATQTIADHNTETSQGFVFGNDTTADIPFWDDFEAGPNVAAGGWAHKFCGVTSPGKVDGVANASIGKVMGVAV